MKLEDKVAIVTGGANGIGRAIALRLAREGADVVVGDIEVDSAKEVIKEIESLGRKGMAGKIDVAKGDDARINKFGKVDILVNNAGGSARERRSLFNESKEEVWDFVININLKGAFNCTRAVINHMIERKSGKIVNIGSQAGMVGTKGLVDYSAAKAGIIGFTMALAKEVASYGINVNCVSPGPIQTRMATSFGIEELKQMTGLGRLGKPEDVAAMVLFLVTDEADYITGQNYLVGGLSNLGF
jgi:NAD(P)-dependent dehydrogenase (short-subunit alcohol dehydrogenase family)